MVKLEDFTNTELKAIARKYNKVAKIAGYSKLKKDELIKKIRGHPNLNVSETEKGVKIKVVGSDLGNVDKVIKEKKPRKPREPKPEPKKPEPKKPEPKPTKIINKSFMDGYIIDLKTISQSILLSNKKELKKMYEDFLKIKEEFKNLQKKNFKRNNILYREDEYKKYVELIEKDYKSVMSVMKKPEPKPKPKPEEPKPKKPEPKPKKPEPKKTDGFNFDDLEKMYDGKALDKPVPFVCSSSYTEQLLFSVVTNRHKNDCILMTDDSKFAFGFEIEFSRNTLLHNSFYKPESSSPKYSLKKETSGNLDTNNKNLIRMIRDRYLNCKKNNKTLVIPFSILSRKGGHENILIFNHKLEQLEHFEPHGASAGFITENQNKTIDKKLNYLINEINKLEGKKILTFKPRDSVCPAGYKGFQRLEMEDIRSDGSYPIKKFGNYQVSVSKDTGYCCAWSFLYLDFRLTKLGMKEQDFYKMLRDNLAPKLKKYIRGLTNDFYEKLIEILKKVQKGKKDYTDELMAKYIEYDIIRKRKGVKRNIDFVNIRDDVMKEIENFYIESVKN